MRTFGKDSIFRIIVGNGFDGTRHAWNIVKIGDKWYNLDLTRDIRSKKWGGTTIEWFLKANNSTDFDGHTPDPFYQTTSFISEHPLSATNFVPGQDYQGCSHNYVNNGTHAPTCMVQGYTEYRCTKCGNTYQTDFVVTDGIHSYGSWTYLDADKHQRVCTQDDSHIDTAAHTWNSGVVTKEPSYTTEGIRTLTCTTCQGTKTQSIPKLIKLESIKIIGGSFFAEIGDTMQLAVEYTPANTTDPKDVTWTSSDPQVGTISAKGLFKATGEGTVIIKATVGAKVHSRGINVSKPLAQAKADSIAELEAYVDMEEYRPAERRQLADILKQAKLSINGGTSTSNVYRSRDIYRAQMDEVKTDEQLSEEEAQARAELQASLDQALQQLAELNDTIEELNSNISTLNNIISDLESQKEALEKQVADLEERMENAEEQVKKLQKNLENAEEQVKKLQKDLNDAEEKSEEEKAEMQAALDAAVKERDELSKEYEETKSSLDQASQQLAELNDTIEELNSNMSTLNNTISDLESQKEALEKQAPELEESLENAEEQVKKLQKDLSEANQKIEALKEELDKAKKVQIEADKEIQKNNPPARVSIKKANGGKKFLTVKWKRLSENVKGYEIRLTNIKTGKKKTIKVKQSKKTIITRKMKKIKKGKYKIGVRAYNIVSGKTYYGKWSKNKIVRIRE